MWNLATHNIKKYIEKSNCFGICFLLLLKNQIPISTDIYRITIWEEVKLARGFPTKVLLGKGGNCEREFCLQNLFVVPKQWT